MNTKVLVFSAILSAGFLHADTLSLRDGRTLDGTYAGGDSREVRFQVNGRTERYDLSTVRSINFGGSSATSWDRRDRDSGYGANRDRGSSDRFRGDARGTIPDGTVVTVRMIDGINSDKNNAGDTFRASIDDPVVGGWTHLDSLRCRCPGAHRGCAAGWAHYRP